MNPGKTVRLFPAAEVEACEALAPALEKIHPTSPYS